MHHKKNPTYFAGESNFEYALKISDQSVKICSSYVSGQFEKSGFEKKSVYSFKYCKIWAFRHFFGPQSFGISFLKP